MAKKKAEGTDGAASAAAGDKPETKTAAAKKFLRENPDLVEKHTYKELAAMVAKTYGFDPTPGDIANAKALLAKGSGTTRAKKVTRRRAATRPGRPAAAVASTPAATTAAVASAPVASGSAGDAVQATLNLVRAVGLEQATAIITGLSKSK